ncbi:MAG: hypothetical protein IPM53_03665 [Anaerolineaceae bacterium]|nr:hypothetical protein [Anaerolineaceae bacterium]
MHFRLKQHWQLLHQGYANRRSLNRAARRLARCQPELSRRQPGSRDRTRAKARLAHLHQRIAYFDNVKLGS